LGGILPEKGGEFAVGFGRVLAAAVAADAVLGGEENRVRCAVCKSRRKLCSIGFDGFQFGHVGIVLGLDAFGGKNAEVARVVLHTVRFVLRASVIRIQVRSNFRVRCVAFAFVFH